MKVCITTAGLGTRMGHYACINKALLPVEGLAAITHIIRAFDADTEFVIALGHLGQQVRDYIAIAHPEIAVEFVEVPEYEGPGTGPLRSLFACHASLRQPFYFVPCDTIIGAPPNPTWTIDADNIVYFGDTQCGETAVGYSVVSIDSDRRGLYVSGMHAGTGSIGSDFAFSGLLKIADFDVFWECVRTCLAIGETEIYPAINRLLLTHPVRAARLFNWRDIGTKDRYERQISKNCPFDFSKPNEFLYAIASGSSQKVIKWFADPTITEKRVARAKMRPELFPTVTDHRNGFMAYEFVTGESLYQHGSVPRFAAFLDWAQHNLWREETVDIREAMRKFYVDKTMERLAMFRAKYPGHGDATTVNEEPVLPIDELLKRVDLEGIADAAIPSFVHGDLQFDHILMTDTGIKLIDWRQDFGGSIAHGDLYYDLAKLLGGIRLNYQNVKQNLISYTSDSKGNVSIKVTQDMLTSDYEGLLLDFIRQNGLSATHTEQLLGIIYLNMAPLHHSPFDVFLYALAQRTLTKALP